MKTIRVCRLTHLSPALFRRLKEAQMEAARVWNRCLETHKNARMAHASWPGHRDLVGSVNMHQDAFGIHVEFPRSADVSPSWLVQVKE